MVWVLLSNVMSRVLPVPPRMSNGWSAVPFLLAIFAVSAPAQAADTRAVLTLIQDTAISGEYASGARFSEAFGADGTTRYTDETGTIEGRVTIRDDVMCFTYPDAGTIDGGCFAVERRGENCFDFYATDTTATPFQRHNGLGWTARAWRNNRASTCEAAAIS